ncbi:hypothetical protein ACTFIZ_007745 [Dictyostelium cf. discoideum]
MENKDERVVVDLKFEIQELERKIRFLKQKQQEQEIQLKNESCDVNDDDHSYIDKNNTDDDDDGDDENDSDKELKELINDYSIYNNTKYSKDFMKGDKKSSKNDYQSFNELNQTNNIIENFTGYKILKTNSNIIKDDDDFRYGDFEYGGYCNQIKFNINFTVGRKIKNNEKEKKKEKEREEEGSEDEKEEKEEEEDDDDEEEEEEEEDDDDDDEDKEDRVDKRIAQQPFIQYLSINVEIPSLVLSSSHFGQFIEYCKTTKSLSDFLKIFQRISSSFKRRNSFFKLLINKINNNNNNNSIISYKKSQIDDYFSSVIIYHEPKVKKPKITIIWEIEYNQMKQSLLEDFRVIGDSTIYSEDTMKEIKEKLNLLSMFDHYPISSLPSLINLITNPNSQQKKKQEEQQQEEQQQEEQQQEEQQEEQQQEEQQQEEQQEEQQQQQKQKQQKQQEEQVQIQEKKRKRIKR